MTGVLRSSLGERPLTDELVLEVVEAAGGEQRSVLQGDEGTVEQVLRSGAAGLELTYLRLDRAPVRMELRPAPPVLALPHRAAEGRTWAWAATSTDGSVTVTSQFHAVRREAVAVGGRTVPSLVVEATVTTTGAFEATSRQTRWVSEERGLVLRQHDVTDGRYQAFTFHSETEQVLQRLEPA